ncbi:hypothetical protein KAX97_05140 [candidate division WOR-3 bacterium]|nr:hypothetical protein [candidate division WOR-3 bacterium]
MGEPTDSENFIVLPFDTSIKRASDLCDESVSGVPIYSYWIIEWWDPETQRSTSDPNQATCEEIVAGLGDFELEPGKVYKIQVTRDADWEQI